MNHIAAIRTTAPLSLGSQPIARTARTAVHRMLTPFSVAYLTAALVTDLAYWRTAEIMWERFSVWLIAGGLIMTAFVAVAAVIDLAFRKHRANWTRVLCFAIAVLLSLLNVLVHSRDGYTAVVPTGVTLSVIAVVLMAFTFSTGWALTYPAHGAR
jgi:uncharacterized membrane protein